MEFNENTASEVTTHYKEGEQNLEVELNMWTLTDAY